MSAASRAFAARLLNEGPEKIGRILEKLETARPLSEKEIAALDRINRPVSDREKTKWTTVDLTPYQWSLLVADRRAAELFEKMATKMW